jgi:tetratricopeptide (TPR) repeat protein
MFALGLLAVLGMGQAQLQTGQALDANPRLGSGGANDQTSSSNVVNGQLIVNKQVTGLSSFHGTTGYFPANQLNLNLPSDPFSRFQQQSVGADQASAGKSYQMAPYYDPARTVLGSRAIAAGLTAPGTNVPISPYASTPAQPLGQPLNYQPLAIPVPPPLEGAYQPSYLTKEPVGGPLSAGGNPLFGVSDTKAAADLARELKATKVGDKEPNRPDYSIDSSVDRAMDFSVPPPAPKDFMNEPGGSITVTQNPSALTAPLIPGRTAAATGGTLRPSHLGEDPYADLRARVFEQDLAVRHLKTERAARAGKGNEAFKEEEALLMGKGNSSLVEAKPSEGLVVHSLAGPLADRFNSLMSLGQSELQGGQFRAAVESFKSAASTDPTNPLAKVGLAVSLFCAGDPLTAAPHLRSAMSSYPPLMRTRLNLSEILDTKMLQHRLNFLSARMSSPRAGAEPDLYFMATYMYANLGMMGEARAYAIKLQKTAGDDSVLANYAQAVLENQTTLETTLVPNTAPATEPSTAR